MTSPIEPNCYKRKCIWMIGVKEQPFMHPGPMIIYCKAFPDGNGIPEEILYGDDLHEKVRKDQVGEFTYNRREDGDYKYY